MSIEVRAQARDHGHAHGYGQANGHPNDHAHTNGHAHDHAEANGEHHEHDHDHAGPSLAESYDHVRGGPPVLDIGGDIGAMQVRLDPEAAGRELHLISEHTPPIAIHTGVWERRQGDDPLTTAVFVELPEGTYWILGERGERLRRVEVTGGALTAIDLRHLVGPER